MTGKTTAAGIVGWAVSPSLSPVMHDDAFRAPGLDWARANGLVIPVAQGEAAFIIRTGRRQKGAWKPPWQRLYQLQVTLDNIVITKYHSQDL